MAVLHGPTGVGKMLLITTMSLSFYAPVVVAVYYANRHSSSIKYRNPSEMAFVAMAAYLNSLARFVGTIFIDDISCTFGLLSFGTKPLTKQRALHWLQVFLRPRYIWIERIVLHIAWNIPPILIVFGDNYTVYAGGDCPAQLLASVRHWYLASFAFMIAASVALSFQISKVVDNFGLRQAFQTGNHFFVYFPILVFVPAEVVYTYHLDLTINVAIVHTLLWIHIVRPVSDFFRASRTAATSSMFNGTARVLDAFLHTPNGFQAMSAFAKSDFMIESVIAWRALVDYRNEMPGHMSALDIYNQFIAPSAPFPLDNVVKGTILKRYAIAFECNNKYSIHPDDGEQGAQYFDVLLDAIVNKILIEMLPRFQRHPLGAGWFDFLRRHHTQHALDKVLDDTIGQAKQSQTMPTIKSAAISRSTGRLAVIMTEGMRTSVRDDDALQDNVTAHSEYPPPFGTSESVAVDRIHETQ
ncbi:hypothetical protein DYB32_009626 [Aphanomyces invadans]|uniref:RGS domain-containing protein n=1 Tax=Aphanomyces invadans TaxID=157072 RepID=A0A3R6ZI92_9STRA|nr:hypothetical protein DYB32_009626 [Aphanomyces invadans]